MKVLISSCLLGQKVRYDAKEKSIDGIEELSREYELIPFCPEVSGGLPIPRESAEIVGKSIDIITNNIKNSKSRVLTTSGKDVTKEFLEGAGKALHLCKSNDIKLAILKSKSPSCGYGKVYDGTHSRVLIDGNGVTSELLQKNGIKIYNENNYRELLDNCEMGE